MTSALQLRPRARSAAAAWPRRLPGERAVGRLEWWALSALLFLQSGALLPLLLSDAYGGLDDGARSKLRLMSMPVALLAAALLARRPQRAVAILKASLPFLALLALTYVSALWSISPSVTVKRAIALTLATLVPLAIAVHVGPRGYLHLAAAVLGAIMVLSLVMLGASPHRALMPDEPVLRGVFLHKNTLGWSSAFGCIVGTTMAADRVGDRRRGGFVLLGLSFVCLVLSGSMTGLLSGVTALLLGQFFAALARSRGLGRVVLVLVMAQLTALLLLFLGVFLVPLLEALGRDATLTGRVPLWKLVDLEIANRPYLGFGYDAFWSEGSDGAWNIWGQLRWAAPHSHNGYRETLLNFGVVGLMLLIWVLVRGVAQGVALQLREPAGGWLWLNVVLGVFLFINLSESIVLSAGDLPWSMVAGGLFMVAGAAAGPPRVRSGAAGGPGSRRR